MNKKLKKKTDGQENAINSPVTHEGSPQQTCAQTGWPTNISIRKKEEKTLKCKTNMSQCSVIPIPQCNCLLYTADVGPGTAWPAGS